MASKHEKTYNGRHGDVEVRKGDGSWGESKYTVKKDDNYAFFKNQDAAHDYARRKAGK